MRKPSRLRSIPVLLLGLLAGATAGADPTRVSLVGSRAPAWDGVRWISGAPPGGLGPASFRGRVVGLLLFRGDAEEGLAAWAQAARRLAGDPEVAFVALQWLGWRSEPISTAEAGREILARHGIPGPHGVSLGDPARASDAPVRRYAARTLPWMVVLDRAGVVRSEGPARGPEALRLEIEALRAAPGAANPLVGQSFGPTQDLRWLVPEGRPFTFAAQPLVLLRWWTNQCPFCVDSLPSLSRLQQRYASRGLAFVPVYHPKGRRLGDLDAREYLRRLGVSGPLGFDDRWAKYLDLKRRGGLGSATSISVLVDASGVVRWVHPGPRIHESPDGRFPRAASDLAALDRLLDRALPSP